MRQWYRFLGIKFTKNSKEIIIKNATLPFDICFKSIRTISSNTSTSFRLQTEANMVFSIG